MPSILFQGTIKSFKTYSSAASNNSSKGGFITERICFRIPSNKPMSCCDPPTIYVEKIIYKKKRLYCVDLQNQIFYYTDYNAEACNELAGHISASLRAGNTSPFEEMLQRWRAAGKSVSDLTGWDLNLRPSASETNPLPLDQLPSSVGFMLIYLSFSQYGTSQFLYAGWSKLFIFFVSFLFFLLFFLHCICIIDHAWRSSHVIKLTNESTENPWFN